MKEVLNIPLETKFEVIKSTHIYTTPSGTEFFADKVPEIKPIKLMFNKVLNMKGLRVYMKQNNKVR